MSWENVVIGEICSVDTQETDTTVAVGGRSLAGTETSIPNPLVGHRIWDRCAYFLTNAGTVDGSFTVEVQGTVAGVVGLPIARKVVDPAIIIASPAGQSAIALESCHNSPYSINPTQVLWDETAAGGITATITVVAKSKRGQTPRGTLTPQRVNEGVIACIPTPPAGRWAGASAGVTAGITQDTVINLTHTTATGTTKWFSQRFDDSTMWDSLMIWMDVIGVSGTWNVYARGVVNGNTVVIAGASGITGVTSISGLTKIAFKNSTHGCGVKPTNFLFDVTSSGVSQSIAGTILYAAKTSRGKRYGR